MPEQVQDFYPTPSTLSTCMYYTGLDPRTMEPVYVPRNPHEKAMQRALIQYRNPKLYDLVAEALEKAGRTDLIGYGSKCLIRPRRDRRAQSSGGSSCTRGANSGAKARPGDGNPNSKRPDGRGPQADKKRKKKTIRNIHRKK